MRDLSRDSIIIFATNIPVITYALVSSMSATIGILWLVTSIGLISHQHRVTPKYERFHPRFESLCKDVEPYLGDLTGERKTQFAYEQYLTLHEKDRILNRTDSLRSDMNKQITTLEKILLVGKTREYRINFKRWLAEIESLVNNYQQYNQDFVERQLDAEIECLDVIGGEEFSLDLDQRRAVIRNDTYNKIIASAGSGKTSVVVARIAYLINNRDIDPKRILAFSYTKKASSEIERRLEDIGIDNVTVQTIHAFGYSVIDSPGSTLNVVDTNDIKNFVREQIQEQSNAKERTFSEHYREFLSWFKSNEPSEVEFDDKEAYLKARQESQYTTIDGKEVASKDEKIIGDYLYRNNISYKYEYHVKWADTSSNKNKYNVDFYLPDGDVYIEHWGIDESGEVADWFTQSTQEYQEKIQWARDQFSKNDERLVETYHFEYTAGNLKRALRARLSDHDIEFDRRGYQELVEAVFEDKDQEQFIIDQFQKFITNAKTFKIYPQEIENNINTDDSKHYHFNKCGIFLLKQYQIYLTEYNLVDFSDLLYDAISKIERNQDMFLQEYDHVLVDEFQDIGAGQRQLIDALTGPSSNPEIGDVRLCAVGDDWQSIYSFQGAVMDFFVDFEDYYGPNAKTTLKNNYRNPRTVVDASIHTIGKNTKQVDKNVIVQSGIDTIPRIHRLHSNNWYGYISVTATRVADLCVGYLTETEASPEDIMILCRYNKAVPILAKIRKTLRERGIPYNSSEEIQYMPEKGKRHPSVDSTTGEGVSVYSIHQSKGREADHVIFAHVATGLLGFPHEDEGRDLLDLVREIDSQDIEEERRLFYVGITRSGGTLDILTRTGHVSTFIEEIEDYCSEAHRRSVLELERPTSITIDVRITQLFNTSHQSMKQSGIIESNGDSIRFVTWSRHDPPTVTEGEWYTFEHVRLRDFQDEPQLQYTNSSIIKHLPHKLGKFCPAPVEHLFD